MTIGEYIKELREGNNKYGYIFSQEELGHKLNPPVNRGAVNKWEKGRVENIKRVHIEQIAEIFGISPQELMCFDTQYDEGKTIEKIQKLFGDDVAELIQLYVKLNELGKKKALEAVADIKEVPKYQAIKQLWQEENGGNMMLSLEERLKEFILSRYDSILQFTDSWDIPYSTLDSILRRGVHNSSFTSIQKICRSLHISIEALAQNKIVYIGSENYESKAIEVRDILKDTRDKILTREKLTLDGKEIDLEEIKNILIAMDIATETVLRKTN